MVNNAKQVKTLALVHIQNLACEDRPFASLESGPLGQPSGVSNLSNGPEMARAVTALGARAITREAEHTQNAPKNGASTREANTP